MSASPQRYGRDWSFMLAVAGAELAKRYTHRSQQLREVQDTQRGDED